MILIFSPYVSIVTVFMRSMIGRETPCVDVSFEEEIPHTFCTTCSKGRMGDGMDTRATPLFLMR